VKNIGLAAVAIVLLGVAGVSFFARGGCKSGAELPSVRRLHCVDLKTGGEYTIEAPMDRVAPFANPSTGELTLYPWYFCNDCKYRFVPAPVPSPNGPPKLPAIPSCPHCGSSNCGTWVPEIYESEKVADAELPKLPQ
jgi:hypothetical protein